MDNQSRIRLAFSLPVLGEDNDKNQPDTDQPDTNKQTEKTDTPPPPQKPKKCNGNCKNCRKHTP